MLETHTVTSATAARFVLGAVGLLPEGLSGAAAETAAYNMAFAQGWIRTGAAEPVTLGEISFLITSAFGFTGGLMYRIFPGPRYAYRELLYRRIIQGRVYSNMTVSGSWLLQIIGRALSAADEEILLGDNP